jgi:type IV pilus assembly protein PilO
MKISRSEKILLAILGALIIVIAYHRLIYVKQAKSVETLRAEKKQVSDKLDNIKLTVASSAKKENDIKILNAKIHDTVDRLYPVIWQEKTLIELNDILAKSKVQGSANTSSGDSDKKNSSSSNSSDTNAKTDINSTAYSNLYSIVDKYNTQVLSGKKEDGQARINNSYTSMKATINFKGTYDNVYALINNIENYNRKIYISSLNISGISNEVSGTVSLEFLSVPKFSDMDTDYYKWNYNNPYGKKNPFSASDGKVVSSSIEEASKPKENVKDFSMSIRTVNSDLPAIMIGKFNDTERKSYLYADNNKVENIEFSFVEENGKYYYKYKTDQGSYPQQYAGNGVEFKPVGNNISISIFSNKRIADTDLVGANIKVVNKTSKSIDVFIANEDSTKPRVTVNGEGNSVNIKSQ